MYVHLSPDLSLLYWAISQKSTAGGKFKLLPEYLTEDTYDGSF